MNDYQKSIKRAGVALLRAESALASAEACGPKWQEPYMRDLREEVVKIEKRVRAIVESQETIIAAKAKPGRHAGDNSR